MDANGYDTTGLKDKIEAGTHRLKPEITKKIEQKIKETGGMHANEKVLKDAIKHIEKSGAAKEEIQKRVLGGMKDTVKHLGKSRKAGYVSKAGIGVAALGAGHIALRKYKENKKENDNTKTK